MMKRSYLIAAVLALAAIAWIGSGQFGDADQPKTGEKPPANLGTADVVPTVRVRAQLAEARTAQIVLHGQTKADRKVDIKSETHGRIAMLAAEKGQRVAKGAVLARIAADERPARLAEAKSLREQRRIEHEASVRLNQKGFRAETQLAAAKAALDAAAAAVKVAEMALEDTTIEAPFDGLIVDRYAEIGDFVEMGDPIARIIDLDPLLVVVQVSERNLGRLSKGTLAQARLIDGRRVEGVVSYISVEADPATRTFRVEVEVANQDGSLADGISAEVALPLQQVLAHRVPPSILTLSDTGRIGVKALGPGDKVTFMPVEVMDEEPAGIWVAGLPERVVLITVGQEFMTDGQVVRPVDEQTLAPFSGAADTGRDGAT